MTKSKEQNKYPETYHEEMQITEFLDKEFKTSLLKMLTELKEDTEGQLTEIS